MRAALLPRRAPPSGKCAGRAGRHPARTMRIKYHWLTIALLVLDQATKWLVRTRMERAAPIELVPGYLRLSYVQNSGVAFGLFSRDESPWKPYLLAALAVVAVVGILVYAARVPRKRVMLRTALATTLGGILGNFVDRIGQGYVIDFIEFHIHESFHWPTFNVADSAISVGIAVLLLDAVRKPQAEAAECESEPGPLR